MFVLILIVLSSFVIAQNETIIPECGLFCKVNKFLFGSSEARALAGTAWFENE